MIQVLGRNEERPPWHWRDAQEQVLLTGRLAFDFPKGRSALVDPSLSGGNGRGCGNTIPLYDGAVDTGECLILPLD